MRIIQLTIIIVLLVLSSAFTLSKKNKPLEFDVKKTDKSLCQVGDSLYAYAFEVSNADYTLFINNLKEANKDWKVQYPDTALWRSCFPRAYCEPFSEHYFSHPAYRKYPVVNVTQEQAIAYCTWLTEIYNGMKKRKFQKVKFRLPNIEEWELAASGGLQMNEYPNEGVYLRRPDGQFLYNFRRVGERNITLDKETGELKIVGSDFRISSGIVADNTYPITAPVDSYWPNNYGLHNCSGNVAEMVSEKGIAKGGSFYDPGYDVRIKSEKKYDKPTPTIGFRVFMEVME